MIALRRVAVSRVRICAGKYWMINAAVFVQSLLNAGSTSVLVVLARRLVALQFRSCVYIRHNFLLIQLNHAVI